MKKTSFILSMSESQLNDFLDKNLPTYLSSNLIEYEPLCTGNGYTVYVMYDETDSSIKELEDCFMTVYMLDDYLDAWNFIHDYTEQK